VLYGDDGSTLAEVGEYLGFATNNVAEWKALVLGLARARELGVEEIAVRLDSELVVRQVTGVYKIKHPALIPLAAQAKALLREFKRSDVRHVRRAENAAADAVVNRVLDEHASAARAGMPH
jgi:probable phosphoglycerate mutase